MPEKSPKFCFLENLKYLIEIKELCETNKINLTLVNMPLHNNFKARTNNYYFECLNNFIKQNEFKNYLDYSSISLDSKYFSDGDHLNIEGSKIFSKKINSRIINKFTKKYSK